MTIDIQQQFSYSYPPNEVWDFLTKADLMALWLMPNDFKPVVGHRFQFTTKPMPQLNCDGIFRCQVLEIVPRKKLSYSWKAGPGDGSINLDTVVTWTLQETPSGTDLHLVHSGFDEKTNIDLYTGMTKGWLDNLKKIDKQLNNLQHGAGNP